LSQGLLSIIVEAFVRIYPLLYLHELQHLLANDFILSPGDVPSITAITNLFTNLHITRKKCMVVALERMSHHTGKKNQKSNFVLSWILPGNLLEFV